MAFRFGAEDHPSGGFRYGDEDHTPLVVGPSIVSVDPLRHTESAVIVVDNLPGAQGTVVLAGGTQTITGWTTDANDQATITITVGRGTNAYGFRPLAITDADGNTVSGDYMLLPQNGWAYVILEAPLADAEDRLTAIPDLEPGWQVAWDTKGGNVEVFPAADFNAAEGVESFDVEAHDGTGWGSGETQTIEAVGGAVTPFNKQTLNISETSALFRWQI